MKSAYLNQLKRNISISTALVRRSGLEQPADVEQLLTELLDLYDVDSSTCRQETRIAEALKRGMPVQTPA